tara:strand:+ start:383 stop:901 length:519 start_codon:yes stop_codon:yes gene_type:complete
MSTLVTEGIRNRHSSQTADNIILNSDGTITADGLNSATSQSCATIQRTSDVTTFMQSAPLTVLTINITPTKSTSKFLITAGGPFDGNDDVTSGEDRSQVQIFRGTTPLGEPTEGYITGGGFYLAFFDSNNHSGNQVSYHLKIRGEEGGNYTNTFPEVLVLKKGTSLSVLEII